MPRRAVAVHDAFRDKIENALVLVPGTIRGEEMIEAAILADDHDHVLDRRDCLAIRIAVMVGVAVMRRSACCEYGQCKCTGLRRECRATLKSVGSSHATASDCLVEGSSDRRARL